jgi:spermidine/putrescine transport system substrate-binding protein
MGGGVELCLKTIRRLGVAFLFVFLAGCQFAPSRVSSSSVQRELVFLNWENDVPAAVLDQFEQEQGVKIVYRTYDSVEEAVQIIRSGERVDVANLDVRYIPVLKEAGWLLPIRQDRLPNYKYISTDFRFLTFDPENHYSIPYNWGITGLLVRTDLLSRPVTRWSDLWDEALSPQVALYRGEMRELVGIALKSLGYSVNTEDPAELEQAFQHLAELKRRAVFVEDLGLTTPLDLVLEGETPIAMAFAYDWVEAGEQTPDVSMVIPEEGTLLWYESFVVPQSCAERDAAELFLNFLMRPDITVEIANFNHYATPNMEAWKDISPEIRQNPLIFPDNAILEQAEMILPLSPQGEKRYQELWHRYMEIP